MECKTVSDRIKTARENLGITKAEAARRLNLTYIGYCRYEYGDRTPSSQTLELIAQCYGTSVDYLTGKTDNKFFSVPFCNLGGNFDSIYCGLYFVHRCIVYA